MRASVSAIDDDSLDLIACLTTRIAMLMEDHCELALSPGKMAPAVQAEAVARPDTAIRDMTVLLAAINAIRPDVEGVG